MSGSGRPRSRGRPLDASDVAIIDREVPFAGFNRLHRLTLRHRRHDGGWSPELEREVFERSNAAAVLPYDPASDKIVLVEQFRPGAYLADLDCWQLEPIAGVIAPGEDALAVARREAREESGCEIIAFEPICTYAVSPGCATETVQVWCGQIDAGGVGGLHGCGDEDEDIRVHVLDVAQALERLSSRAFQYALTIICLQWLALNRDRLRALWHGA